MLTVLVRVVPVRSAIGTYPGDPSRGKQWGRAPPTPNPSLPPPLQGKAGERREEGARMAGPPQNWR